MPQRFIAVHETPQGSTELRNLLHRGDFRSGGRASISGISSGSVQRCSSQPGRRAWRAVSRTSRARGYEPRPQDATPRSAFQDRLRKTPLHERGWQIIYYKPVT